MKRSFSSAAAAIIVMFPGFILLLLAIVYQPVVMAILPPDKAFEYYAEHHLSIFSWIFAGMGALSIVGAILLAKTRAGNILVRYKWMTGMLFCLHMTLALILVIDGALASRGTVPSIPKITYHHAQYDYRTTPEWDRISYNTNIPYDFEKNEHADDILPEKGVKRVLFLGDSVVYGDKIEADEAIPHQLQMQLGDGYEVVNAGILGYDFSHYYYYAEDLIEKLEPDIILLGICLNDLSLTNRHRLTGDPLDDDTEVEAVTALNKIKWWFRNHSGLLNINRALNVQPFPANEEKIAYLVVRSLTNLLEKPGDFEYQTAVSDVYLGEFADLVKDHKIPTIAIIFPFRFQYEEWADTRHSGHRDLQHTIARLCNKHDIPVVDFYDAVGSIIHANDGDPDVAFVDYDHFNPQGAITVSEWLAPHVLAVD